MKPIDIQTWSRRELYEHFSTLDHPFYSVTVPLDVTNALAAAHREKLSFYHTMVWLCTRAMLSVPAFNLRIIDGRVYELDSVKPSFTAPAAEGNFMFVTLPWNSDLRAFCAGAQAASAAQTSLFGPYADACDTVFFSCLPWFDFTAMTNARRIDSSDAIPRLAWGKYASEGRRTLLHLSIEVNHRTVDGRHIGQFIAAVERGIASLDDVLQ
ncbi:MAG: CatA-like O-acetyltransferase [Clostridia bacterium]|nr:CatA-like O-acetyltransferase [Clostridia bacterium]